MKRLLTAVLALGFVAFLPACDSGPDMSSPEAAVKSMKKAMTNGDTDAITKLTVEGESPNFDEMEEKKKKEVLKMTKKMGESMKIVEVKDKKEKSAKVIVKAKVMGKEREMPIPVKKTDKGWQIAKMGAM